MEENQLDLFDDLPNVVGDDYKLSVTLSFERLMDGERTIGVTRLEGEKGDQLDHVLPMIAAFLRHLGFSYVDGLVAINADGEEIG